MKLNSNSHLYITGDTHGENISRFSYRWYPELRSLTEKDVVIILGDTALAGPNYEEETAYTLNVLNKTKPFEIWFLTGNHDNYDYFQSLPIVDHYGGKMRRIVGEGVEYDKYYAIPDPTIINFNDKELLLIPHAESHDAKIIVEPEDKLKIKQLKRNQESFRVNHVSWGKQEKLNIEELKSVIGPDKKYFDFILSHDAPGNINEWFKRPRDRYRMQSTEGQEYLEFLRTNLNFNQWWHGHFHFDSPGCINKDMAEYRDSRMYGIYRDIKEII